MFHVKLEDQSDNGIILVIGCQQINRLVTQEQLVELDFQVLSVKTGLHALEILEQFTVSLVLMDLDMPLTDGVETASRIRANDRFKQLPIVALTTGMTHEQLSGCLVAGINDILTKPVQPELLTAVLSKLLPASTTESPRTNDEQCAWPAVPGLDIPLAVQRLNGKVKLYFQLLDKFQEQYADASNAILKLLDTYDITGAIRLLHSISGAAAHLGAVNLQQKAASMEHSLREDQNRPLEHESFSDALQEVMQSIGTLLNHRN